MKLKAGPRPLLLPMAEVMRMRWLTVAVFVLLWVIGLFAGAGAYIHLLLIIALLLGAVNLLAGPTTS